MRALARWVVAAVVMAGVATPASAALIGGVIPGAAASNEFIGPLPGTTVGNSIGGYFGGQLYLTGTADIKVEWFGGEAGYNNEFLWNGVSQFTHPGGNNITGSALDSETFNNVGPGLLPFSFFVPVGSLTVANGSNTDNLGTDPNYFVTFNLASTAPGGQAAGSFVWIFFDDGGAANDDNHDDMAIKLSVTGGSLQVVPEPGSMLLLGSGLAAALWMKRRRRS